MELCTTSTGGGAKKMGLQGVAWCHLPALAVGGLGNVGFASKFVSSHYYQKVVCFKLLRVQPPANEAHKGGSICLLALFVLSNFIVKVIGLPTSIYSCPLCVDMKWNGFVRDGCPHHHQWGLVIILHWPAPLAGASDNRGALVQVHVILVEDWGYTHKSGIGRSVTNIIMIVWQSLH